MSAQQQHTVLAMLEQQKRELENSVEHLLSSNAELKEAIATGGPDPDFKLAIEENIVTIVKQRARIASLETEIEELKRGILGSGGVALQLEEQAAAPQQAGAQQPPPQPQQATAQQQAAAQQQQQQGAGGGREGRDGGVWM